MTLRKLFAVFVLLGTLWLVPAASADNGGLVDFGVAYCPEAWPEGRWETDFFGIEIDERRALSVAIFGK